MTEWIYSTFARRYSSDVASYTYSFGVICWRHDVTGVTVRYAKSFAIYEKNDSGEQSVSNLITCQISHIINSVNREFVMIERFEERIDFVLRLLFDFLYFAEKMTNVALASSRQVRDSRSFHVLQPSTSHTVMKLCFPLRQHPVFRS